jgi:hypothetical protein
VVDDETRAATPRKEPLKLTFWGLSFDAHRVIYATIILMTALAIYDEGHDPLRAIPILTMFGIAVAPLFALAMAHAFSDALDLQIREGRRLTGRDRRHLLVENLEYLYIALPPLLLSGVLSVLGWGGEDVVSLVQLLGAASLAMWGVLAARTAGLSRWGQFRFAVAYAFMGLLVVGVELILTH